MRRATAAGMCIGLVAFLAACGVSENTRDVDGQQAPAVRGNPTAGRTGPLPTGGAASCVESYNAKAVQRRAFAFDGVVLSVGRSVSDRGDDGDLGLQGVTFEVREWFAGGDRDKVTVDLQEPSADEADSSDPNHTYGIGSRLLVSGEARWGGKPLDHPIAWNCGFSRYYDPATATAWRNTMLH